ncbi:MAG: homoserine dehydrogenase, partial [Aggregatilineales bacterium]
MKIALIGFGTVGQGFVNILNNKQDMLKTNYHFEPQIVAVATRSRGTLACSTGLDPQQLLDAIAAGHLSHYPESQDIQRDADVITLIAESDADILVEVSHTNLETAEPALSYCLSAFEHGKDVVMANKGPVALHFETLHKHATKYGRRFRYEGTVMAGTPS